MRTENSQRYSQWEDDDYSTDNIIYLYDYSKTRKAKDTRRADAFWNAIFVAACLSVLVILFLH